MIDELFSHREASAHACKAEDPAASSTSKNAAARALLEKHFPSISSGSTLLNSKANSRITSASKTPLNPKKADHMRKVQVMKMRHKAQPGDPRDKGKYVAMDDKIHLHVSVNNSDNEGSFWFRKVKFDVPSKKTRHLQLGQRPSPRERLWTFSFRTSPLSIMRYLRLCLTPVRCADAFQETLFGQIYGRRSRYITKRQDSRRTTYRR